LAVIAMNNLKSMPVDKLTQLRERVNAVLGVKVAEERQALEDRLGALERLTGIAPGRKRMGSGARGPVAPKYRNPDNPAETWAGRGLKPRWLSAALRAGHKLKEFSIQTNGKAVRRVNAAPRKAMQK
jgi:DNA-binding protein H-NS